MKDYEIIIIGGGPAGSSCAWKLHEAGKRVLVLDKQAFPREKLCAGWVTPEVFQDLEITPEQCPVQVTQFEKMKFSFYGIPVTMKTQQYAIRRYEFDEWLLKRSGAEVKQHAVKNIQIKDDYHIIDNMYRCKYLVGAGGTHCPVNRLLFKDVNKRGVQFYIVTIEKEIRYDHHNADCHLWFFDKGFPGYSWYVPKLDNYLNIGIGGSFTSLKKKKTILEYWHMYIDKLVGMSLLKQQEIKPSGYNYYIRHAIDRVRIGNAFITGDAAGLATKDMAEGIGPAIMSGKLAARAIVDGVEYSVSDIHMYSASRILYYMRKIF